MDLLLDQWHRTTLGAALPRLGRLATQLGTRVPGSIEAPGTVLTVAVAGSNSDANWPVVLEQWMNRDGDELANVHTDPARWSNKAVQGSAVAVAAAVARGADLR